MPWYEKDHQPPFDERPIPGFSYLHGDVVAQKFAQEWTRGKKYPLISFPSGTSRELLAIPSETQVHLFGRLTLPQAQGYAEHLDFLTHQSDYRLTVTGDGERHIVIVNPETHRGYTLQYGDTNEIINITPLPHAAMEILPGDLRAVLPKRYSTEQHGMKAIAPIKFFTPDANWTWYPTEFDGDDLFFGLVSGFELELGYFTLSELEGVRGLFGLPIERDLYFTPKSLHQLRIFHQQQGNE
jgi:hypothetical protein